MAAASPVAGFVQQAHDRVGVPVEERHHLGRDPEAGGQLVGSTTGDRTAQAEARVGVAGEQRGERGVGGDSRPVGAFGRSAGAGDLPGGHVEEGGDRRQCLDVVGGEEHAEDRGTGGEGHEEHRGPLGRHALLSHPAGQRQPRHVDGGHPGDADVGLLQQREQLPSAHAAGDRYRLELQLAVRVYEGAGGRTEGARLVRPAMEAGPGVVEQDVGGVRRMGSRGKEDAGRDGQTDRGDQGPAHPSHCDQGYAPRRSLAELPGGGAQRRRGRTRTGISSGTGRRGRDARTAAAAAAARPPAVSTQITWTAYPRTVVLGWRG